MENICKLYIVVPCYNEEEILTQKTFLVMENLVSSLISKNEISEDSKVVYVDDGSKDNTWQLIVDNNKKTSHGCGVKLSHNKGHQNALMAGLEYALMHDATITISIDADLQDDINAIPQMIDEYKKGNEIVYGVRNDRTSDSFFKKFTAEGFYKLMSFFGVEIINNHADFRLMSKVALEKLFKYEEVNLFLRAIVPTIGLKSSCVYYSRLKRDAGESKYPLKKMIAFALDGITSFSIKPIKFITAMGILSVLISAIGIVYVGISFLLGNIVHGWSSLFLSIWFLGGVQLISIGVIGEYIGKIYMETKHRPRYFIEMTVD